MAQGDVVADHEELIRALYEPLWCAAQNRPASNAFCHLNASVSRTSVLPYDEIVRIFRVDRDGAAPVVVTCTILARDVRETCAAFPADGIDAHVIEEPITVATPDESLNPAHAEIRAWKTNSPGEVIGLSKKISKALTTKGTLRPVP